MHRIKWLLVEWELRSGGLIIPSYGVVHKRCLLEPHSELHTGKLIFVAEDNGEVRRAKIVMTSDDKKFLQQQVIAMEEHCKLMGSAALQASFNRRYTSPSARPAVEGKTVSVGTTPSWHSPNSTDSDSDSNRDQDNYRGSRNMKQTNSRTASRIRSRKVKPYKYPTSDLKDELMTSKNMLEYEFRQGCSTSRSHITSTPYIKEKKTDIMTYDQGTQTNMLYQPILENNITTNIEAKVREMEMMLEEISEKMLMIEASLGTCFVELESPSESLESPISHLREQNVNSLVNNSPPPVERNVKMELAPKQNSITKDTNVYSGGSDEDNMIDLVPIGSGTTFVPRHLLNQIEWNSYTMATRKLLMAVFPRRTLATHSLTGKSSPAFSNKPAKLCLDPVRVNDIVLTVTNQCGVKETLVRSAITTKCADENKMYRMRLEKNEKRKSQIESQNQENIPPLEESRDEIPIECE